MVWDDKLVTAEGQERMLEEILLVYKKRGTAVQWEKRTLPMHSLIATQNGIEADKLEAVVKQVKQGGLDIPVIVEEHFSDGRYSRYLIDGHCRTRARIEMGQRTTEAYVIWSAAGEFSSNFVRTAETYGNIPVRDLPLI